MCAIAGPIACKDLFGAEFEWATVITTFEIEPAIELLVCWGAGRIDAAVPIAADTHTVNGMRDHARRYTTVVNGWG